MKKNILKGTFLAAFLAMTASANAQYKLSIDPLTIEPGKTATLTVNLENEDLDVGLVEFWLKVPDGIGVTPAAGQEEKKANKKTYKGDGLEIVEDHLDGDWEINAYSHKFKGGASTGIQVSIMAKTSDDMLAENDGPIVRLELTADADVAEGKYEISFFDVIVASNAGAEYSVTTEPGELTVGGAVEEGAKVNISASGRTVYFDEAKSLDFSSLTDVTAWVVVNATASKVYTKQVEKVPPMTAVIVEGPASTEVTIPYTTEEVEAPEANILTPITESFVIDDSNYGKIYILSGGVFKKAKNGLTMPVGKAYFELPEATARIANEELEIVNGEATGIQNVNVENENAPVYNLNGVRVNKLQKGVYIQNGHKFIVK